MQGNWLEDVIVVNESSTLDLAGDVSVFRSAGEACRYVEPWWVEEARGYALTATGKRVVLRAGRLTSEVALTETFPEGANIVRAWLRASAEAVLNARRTRQDILGSIESEGVLPETVEGLIAYVGFTR